MTDRQDLSALRMFVFERAKFLCEWPGCGDAAAELAHLRHRGMGGSPSANTPNNCAALCRYHHHVLDGVTIVGRRFAVSELLREVLARRSSFVGEVGGE